MIVLIDPDFPKWVKRLAFGFIVFWMIFGALAICFAVYMVIVNL